MKPSKSVRDTATDRFPTTEWSEILTAQDPAHPACREKLERLLGMYWRPVFAYVRAAWRKSIEDAQDLTQAFFTDFLEKNYLARLRPERGSFRGYLKHALKYFLIDAERAAAARRPAKPLFRLNATSLELDRMAPISPEDTPDQAYDREWFLTVVDQAIDKLEAQLGSEGKSVYFDVFRAYCPEALAGRPTSRTRTVLGEDSAASPTYGEVADRLGLTKTDVRNYLSYCRKILRNLFRQRIRTYVVSDKERDRELQEVTRA